MTENISGERDTDIINREMGIGESRCTCAYGRQNSKKDVPDVFVYVLG